MSTRVVAGRRSGGPTFGARAIAAVALAAFVWSVGARAASAAPPPSTRDELICRGNSAVGFSYWWGGSCWCRSGCDPDFSCWAGDCDGNCPSCTHSGSHGADCSGFVNKVWQVPDPIATTTCGHGPFVANSYRSDSAYWNVIPRDSVQPGDALASSTHVVLFHYGDPWGSMMAYEARGCDYGIVHNLRSCSSSYSAARRINLVSPCECTPGQVESEGCGNCGTRSRTCQSSCTWSSFTACTGEGPCSPGATQTADCCDCGTESRTCTGQCDWGAWTDCHGPDPPGEPVPCDTDEPGPCADGTVRCVQGCLACSSTYTPTAELCDGIDNDCSGEVDDGQPSTMGERPPEYAARLLDLSYPQQLEPGETAQAWVAFTNEGSRAWRRREVWLTASRSYEPAASELYDRDSWPAWDTAAVLDRDVAPGDAGTFRFTIRAPEERGIEVAERFVLFLPEGGLLRCPAPAADLVLRVGGRLDEDGDDPDDPAAAIDATGGCSCQLPRPRSGASLAVVAALIGLRVGRRRRR